MKNSWICKLFDVHLKPKKSCQFLIYPTKRTMQIWCDQPSFWVTQLILSFKVYSKLRRLIRRQFVNEWFLFTIKHDKVTICHVTIKCLLKECSFLSDRFYIPTDIPDKIICQVIFKIRKLINNIWKDWLARPSLSVPGLAREDPTSHKGNIAKMRFYKKNSI